MMPDVEGGQRTMEAVVEKIYSAVLKGSKEETEEAVQAAIDAGV